MKKKCVTCNHYGKTATCAAYDYREASRINSLVERAARGYCNYYVGKMKEERRLPRG
jgi:hypothetical protein